MCKKYTIILLMLSTIILVNCGTVEPTGKNTGNTVIQTLNILDSTSKKFIEIAKTNTNLSPGEVLVKTAEWVKTLPDVANAWWYDSSYIDIKLKSGLKTTYGLAREGKDKLSDTRGGMLNDEKNNFDEILKSKNIIKNKSVLIYTPFVFDDYPPDFTDLYSLQELVNLENTIKNYNKDFNVKILKWDEASISAIDSFRHYGLVLINTHGLPDGFYTGATVSGISKELLSDEEIKKALNLKFKPNGYQKYLNGHFRFAYLEHIANVRNWQQYLVYRSDFTFLLIANSEYLYTLAPMPNTVIVGNFCYSGWGIPGDSKMKLGGQIISNNPIRYAFTNLSPIAYYAYGYDDGKSAPVGNDFAKSMEKKLLVSLIGEGDSTGNAYLNNDGKEYTENSLGLKSSGDPNMPFKLFGANDYSFDDCSEFTDPRDGEKYKVVCIGDMTWMAENLRFSTGGACYPGIDCKKYGKLYDWNTLMKGSAPSDKVPSGVTGICPPGWHIPSMAEWKKLIESKEVGGKNNGGAILKATTDWSTPNNGATDKLGFKALPGGLYHFEEKQFFFHGLEGHWWSATEGHNPGNYYFTFMTNSQKFAYYDYDTKPGYMKSCRCVKD